MAPIADCLTKAPVGCVHASWISKRCKDKRDCTQERSRPKTGQFVAQTISNQSLTHHDGCGRRTFADVDAGASFFACGCRRSTLTAL